MPRKSRILALGLALAAVVAAGTFTFIHNSPAAHAGGTGGGCISTTGAPVCTVKGNSAFAEYESFTDCVGTQAFVDVSEQVSHNPPAASNTSLGVFAGSAWTSVDVQLVWYRGKASATLLTFRVAR